MLGSSTTVALTLSSNATRVDAIDFTESLSLLTAELSFSSSPGVLESLVFAVKLLIV